MDTINTVLCVFTRILGGNTFSKELQKHIDSCGYSKVTYIDYDAEIFQKYPPPFYCRSSDALASAWRIHKKFKDNTQGRENYDALYFQGYQLTLPFFKAIKQKYVVLSLDATPMNAIKHNLKAKRTVPYSNLNSFLSYILNTFLYRRIFNNINMFLARTELVKHSLIKDYGIPEEKIVVTYLPVDNIQKHATGSSSKRLQLLFVGNDWARKGGDFLLEAFDDTCAQVADLTIVSNDSKVKSLQSRDGVNVINGLPRGDVISLMRQSDVFLFPSWKDELGLVLCEAVSQGMAIIARKSGAQNEFVEDSVNGRLLDFTSSPEDWRRAILDLALRKDKLFTYKKESLSIAAKKLNPKRFEKKLKSAFPRPSRDI